MFGIFDIWNESDGFEIDTNIKRTFPWKKEKNYFLLVLTNIQFTKFIWLQLSKFTTSIHVLQVLNPNQLVYPSISMEWILYTCLLPVPAWREGNIVLSAKSIYIAAGLGNKKISFPFPPHH
jgi:hypothetical protein